MIGYIFIAYIACELIVLIREGNANQRRERRIRDRRHCKFVLGEEKG